MEAKNNCCIAKIAINILFSSLIYRIIIFLYIMPCVLLECDFEKPIIRQGYSDCQYTDCTVEEFESGICRIDNKIMRSQKFTSIIQFSDEGYTYALIVTTPNGNLIASSCKYLNSLKYYYGLKENGRLYYSYNGEEKLIFTTDSDQPRYEGNMFGIKLNVENNDNEYIIGFGVRYNNFEIYDFENNILYKEPGLKFFNTSDNLFHRGEVLKLNCPGNYYIIGIIGNTMAIQQYNVYLYKLQFTSLDISSYSPIVKVKMLEGESSKIVSCFETKTNYIICFYGNNKTQYFMVVLDQDLNEQQTELISTGLNYVENIFFKCVHFVENSGAFIYYESDKRPVVQFKKYDSGKISNHFNSISQITLDFLDSYTLIKYNDLIKLDDNKICFGFVHSDRTKLYFVIINNYSGENIK